MQPSAVMCSVRSWPSPRKKYLDDLSREAGVAPEWKQLLRDLDRLQQARLRCRCADWLVRTDAAPTITVIMLELQWCESPGDTARIAALSDD
jgi:hypothetical protein